LGNNLLRGGKSIGVYGSEAQKDTFLPQIAAGKLRAAIASTEPGGGADVLGALRTEAVRGDGGWVVSGEKIWSSSAHVVDYLLLARTDKNVKKRHQGVTLFWIPTNTKGVSITLLAKLGMRSLGTRATRGCGALVRSATRCRATSSPRTLACPAHCEHGPRTDSADLR
jgi:acyl-CoA dehydrogenase